MEYNLSVFSSWITLLMVYPRNLSVLKGHKNNLLFLPEVFISIRLYSWIVHLWLIFGVPWTSRTSNQSILKKINPECSLKGLMLKLKLQYFGHLIWRADSLEKILMLEKIEGRYRNIKSKIISDRQNWKQKMYLKTIEWI